MKPPLPGSAAGLEVGRPQISRFSSVTRSGFGVWPGNATSTGTVVLNRLKKPTGCPLNVFGATFWTNCTTSCAYVGDPTWGAWAAMAGSGPGKMDWLARVMG